MADYLGKLSGSLAFDYRSPFMRATIVTADGTRYPLWTDLNLSPEDQQTAQLWDARTQSQLNALPYLQELTIEMQPAYLAIMKAKLVFPYYEGIAFLNSRLIEWGYSTLEVVIGYTGGSPQGPNFSGQHGSGILSPSFSGVILIPEIEIGTQITVTLNAQGVGGFAAIGTTRSGGPYVGTRRELLKVFADGPNELVPRRLKLDFSKVDPPAKDVYTYAFQKFEETVEVSPGGRNDWTIMYELINEADCWMTLVGDTLQITPKADLSQPVSRIFRHYGFQDGDISSNTNTYPIISASSVAPAIYLPTETVGYWAADIDNGDPSKIIKKVINHETPEIPHDTTGQGNVSPAATPVTPTTSATASNTTSGNQDGLGLFVGSPNVPRWVDQMVADHKKWAGNIGIHLNLTSVGIPDLLPLETIAIRGLGDRMDNVFYSIFKIIHTIGLSGFTTYMECFSNVQGKIQQDLFPPQNTGKSTPVLLPDENDTTKIPAKVENKVQPKKTKEEIELEKLINEVTKPQTTKQQTNIITRKVVGK